MTTLPEISWNRKLLKADRPDGTTDSFIGTNAISLSGTFLGLTNGGYRTAAQIFVNKKQDIGGTEQILVPSLEALEYEERNGLRCTTVNQTIVDLLEQNGDEQIITESLANYYDEHQESFDGLEIPEHLQSGKTTHRRVSG